MLLMWKTKYLNFVFDPYIQLICNPIQNGSFQRCWQKDLLPKICHTYPTMMKLGTGISHLKKIQKMYKSHDTPLYFLKGFFNRNIIPILLMSLKSATPSLFKIMIFLNKCYDLLTFIYDVTNKVSSHDSNYILDVVM